MDVLLFIIGLTLLAGLLVLALGAAAIVGLFLFAFLPTIIGLIIGVWVWRVGSDNIGILIILAGIICQVIWSKRMENSSGGGGSNPMSGKSKIYNKSGDVVGYQDKD